MARKFHTHIDLQNTYELRGTLLELLTSDPTGVQGRIQFRTDLGKIKFYTAAWHTVYDDTTTLNQITAPTASVAMNSQKFTGMADGTAATDSATWGQVQSMIQGGRYLAARVASTANVSLPPGGTTLTIDTIALANGDYVLLKNQTATAENGLRVVGGIGTSVTLNRAAEMDTAAEVDGRIVIIEDGTQAGTLWVTTSDVVTLNTDTIVFTQFNRATDIVGGAGLTLTGLTLDVNVDNSSIEINTDILRVKALGIVNAMIAAGTIDLTTKVTGALPIGNGGTGQTTAKAARETGLNGTGIYTSATHGAGTTITITQATHLLRSQRGLLVQVQDETSGAIEDADVAISAGGDVTVTFGVSQGANTKRVTIVG